MYIRFTLNNLLSYISIEESMYENQQQIKHTFIKLKNKKRQGWNRQGCNKRAGARAREEEEEDGRDTTDGKQYEGGRELAFVSRISL